MKKILVIALMFFLIPYLVEAKSTYWQTYFEKLGSLEVYPNYNRSSFYTKWENVEKTYHLDSNSANTDSFVHFNKHIMSKNMVFEGAISSITSSNSSVITIEQKEYDFQKEKEYFYNYIDSYNELTLQELNEKANTKYSTKPTWWSFNGFTKEITNWWEAYGLKEEPTKATEIILHGHDLGSSKITIKKTGKEDIVIDWKNELKLYNKNRLDGVIAILENWDTYQNDFPFIEENKNKYNLIYEIEDATDIKEIIDALKGKNITICFDIHHANNFFQEYYVNGKDIKNDVSKGFTYYTNISYETSKNKEKIDALLPSEKLYIDFAYHGTIPTKYTVTYNITNYVNDMFLKEANCLKTDLACQNKAKQEATEYVKNGLFTLYTYKEDTNELKEIQTALKASSNGEITLNFDNFSSYVLVKAKNVETTNNKIEPEEENPQTSDNRNAMLLLWTISVVGIMFSIPLYCKIK